MEFSGFGKPVRRREDDRLVTGKGFYADDMPGGEALHVAFARSPHASAQIGDIDVQDAVAVPGVVAAYTAADLDAAGIADFSSSLRLPNIDGSHATATPRPLLARDRVRYGAEPVVMVLATSAAIAQDAAELVQVDYEPIQGVSTVEAAAAADAPLIWPERAGNVAFHWRRGDPAAIDAALAASHHVATLSSRITRSSAMPMEPRAVVAWEDETGRPTIRVSHQSPHRLRDDLCAMFGFKADQIRVLAGDVGGSFGMKSGPLREESLVFWAACHIKRPVRWTASRSEAFLSDEHARDIEVSTELGLTAEGHFTALRVRYDVNVGAYLSGRSAAPIGNFGGIAGVYRTPLILGEAIGHFTNTQPTAPYRGAGRPEATYAIERIIDLAAQEMGFDAAELRRRNLIPPEAMPYQTPFVFRYDCGEFERNLDKALELADYAGFPERRAASASRGLLRGIGIASPIEVAGGPFGRPATDFARVRANADGTVTLYSGAMSVGQGLETALSSIVAERLELPLEAVRYVQGDTSALADGKGNGGSAALTLCGPAISLGLEEMLQKAERIAADQLEVSALDLEFGKGEFRIVGSDRSIGLAAIARIAEEAGGPETDGELAGAGEFQMEQPTYPNGCHICEVEIDPETGKVRPLAYICVEDVGRVMNPMLVAGQIHGGVAQGIGQAMMEEIRYDADAQLLSGSFMDYAMPRADDLPSIVGETLETPTGLNPLGVKGVGEAGTVGGMAAMVNAVCHALQPLGIRHLDMPATPDRVWRAIHAASGNR